VVSNGVAEEPISSELVLVDQALARRARAALPDPPWLVPALVELRERPTAEAPAPSLPDRPAPSEPRRPGGATVVLVGVALAVFGLPALAFVPQSRGPFLVTTPVRESAPAVPVRPPAIQRPKAETTQKPAQPRPAAKPKKTPQGQRPAASTSPKRRASKPAAAPKPRTLTRAQRTVTWRRYPAAVYYEVFLQRGAKTLYEARTLRPSAVLPANLRLRPGMYRVLVRPAIPSDAGIILGSTILSKTVRL
jgi:hypothetical protein